MIIGIITNIAGGDFYKFDEIIAGGDFSEGEGDKHTFKLTLTHTHTHQCLHPAYWRFAVSKV